MIKRELTIDEVDFESILIKYLDLDENDSVSSYIEVPRSGDYSGCKLYLDEEPLHLEVTTTSDSDKLLIAAARDKIRERYNTHDGESNRNQYQCGIIDMLMEVVEGDFTREMLRDKIHGK